jgi:hypothetical protein
MFSKLVLVRSDLFWLRVISSMHAFLILTISPEGACWYMRLLRIFARQKSGILLAKCNKDAIWGILVPSLRGEVGLCPILLLLLRFAYLFALWSAYVLRRFDG